ncbi:Serine/threonine protein kinase [Flavobacterium anhuiense]|uniref:Serine/threonine protein kinase n=1 Tax=Flavobacterium anhuiense TaxID=459526 RepID=A0A444VUQ6_9FLAO|nr:family 16 glycoside hydrolase [Flavobacterium anhuiense]RYJ37124.1 Serine/threonine protein kinase [Flavobacterium anhuiense]
MKTKFAVFLLLQFILISCSSTISTVKKEYTLNNSKELKSDWTINSKEWILKKDTLTGKGSLSPWGVLVSKKQLPANYEIDLKVNMTNESLFEIMLNLDKRKYIRTYLYQIDQNIVIGDGVYDKKDDSYGKRGGKTLFRKPMQLENNKWYAIKIKVVNNQLSFSVDGKTTLECSLEKSNLNQKGKLGFITNGEVKITDLSIKYIQN